MPAASHPGSLPRTATASTVASSTQPAKTPAHDAGSLAPISNEKQQRTAPGDSTPVSGSSGPPGGYVAPLEVSRWRFIAIFVSLMVSIFLFALDQLIVATAIPKITVEFNSLTQLPWLASGFFLTLLGFNLIYAQWLQIFPSKLVIMSAVIIFEVGSLVCGVAPDMNVLILGRAIAGWGAAGIFSGAMVVMAELTTLSERPKYFAFFGVCFAIASIIGPLVGGAFSDHVTWRWCFYINLPFGGIAILMLAFFQPLAPPLGQADTYKGLSRDMVWRVLKCDWVGVALTMGWGCSIILALQWGGVTRAWSDGGVITCLVLTAVLPVVFVAWEYWLGKQAMFRLELLKSRSIAGSSIVLVFLFGLFMLEVYYISLAFQAVYGNSATMAGVKLLPMILVQIVVLIASSRIIPKLGRFKWVIVSGPVFLMIGCGLLYTVKYGVPETHIMGFEALLGVGIGVAMQNTMLAVQFELRNTPQLISAGTGLATFLGFGGRILGISLAGSVFENMLQVNLHKYVPQLSEEIVHEIVNSADAVYAAVPPQYREATLIAYTDALRVVYIIGVPFGAVALIGALMIKNSKMPTKAEEQEHNRIARERAAAARTGLVATSTEAEKGQSTPVGIAAADATEVANREQAQAETLTAVAPVPAAVVEADAKARP